jgi:hypothetical protein
LRLRIEGKGSRGWDYRVVNAETGEELKDVTSVEISITATNVTAKLELCDVEVNLDIPSDDDVAGDEALSVHLHGSQEPPRGVLTYKPVALESTPGVLATKPVGPVLWPAFDPAPKGGWGLILTPSPDGPEVPAFPSDPRSAAMQAVQKAIHEDGTVLRSWQVDDTLYLNEFTDDFGQKWRTQTTFMPPGLVELIRRTNGTHIWRITHGEEVEYLSACTLAPVAPENESDRLRRIVRQGEELGIFGRGLVLTPQPISLVEPHDAELERMRSNGVPLLLGSWREYEAKALGFTCEIGGFQIVVGPTIMSPGKTELFRFPAENATDFLMWRHRSVGGKVTWTRARYAGEGPAALSDAAIADLLAKSSDPASPPPSAGPQWIEVTDHSFECPQLGATVMMLGHGTEWWATVDGAYITSRLDGLAMSFPTREEAMAAVEKLAMVEG